MLEGLMQNDYPLTLHHALERMRTLDAGREVVTLYDADAGPVRATHGEIAERIDRLGRVLERLGVQPGERVATFAWNSQRHYELYLAIPCFGAVLHTLNIRLFADQIEYIINHAENRVVFIDDSLVGLIAPHVDKLPNVEHWVVMGDGEVEGLPNVLRYEELLAEAGGGEYAWPEVDERAACALCYTSGTTGNPKGVLYSHRSTMLHAMAGSMVDTIGVGRKDKILSIVPMFHANAWGLPFTAALVGASMVFPTKYLQAEPLAKLIETERCTVVGGVPTVMTDLLRYVQQHGTDVSSIDRGLCGGSAVSRQLMEAWEELGFPLYQAWGMTETSPIACFSRPPAGLEGEDYWQARVSQGRIAPLVELRLMGDEGVQPWDGEAVGEIQVRGPWIARKYYADDSGDDKFEDGWLKTGDIGTCTPDGYVYLTDRAKDLIKSGGEWISSVELENEIMAHPAVAEAAVIAKPDDKWAERPLACVVVKEGEQVTAEQLCEHLSSRVAKWWLPDEFAFIPEVPKTSTMKFDKKALRAQLAEDELPNRVMVQTAKA